MVQAKALLLAADGVGTNEVARRCQTTDDSVRAWRRRFAEHGVEGVWHKTAEEIIAKVRRGRTALTRAKSATHH